MMSKQNGNELIVCRNPSGERRVVIDPNQQTVTFENCHLPNQFLPTGADARRTCRFDEITKVNDLLIGENQGLLLRGAMSIQGDDPNDLSSIFIYTKFGNARIFADWDNFAELHLSLLKFCKPKRNGYGIDNPNMAVIYAFFGLMTFVVLLWIFL